MSKNFFQHSVKHPIRYKKKFHFANLTSTSISTNLAAMCTPFPLLVAHESLSPIRLLRSSNPNPPLPPHSPPLFASLSLSSAMVMDKSSLPPPPPPPPPASSASAAAASSALKALNKSSYKISKQTSSSSLASMKASQSPPPPPHPRRPSPPPLPPPPAPPSSAPAAVDHPPPQPPVYNIDKSDFRDVVQKLTGSPCHLLPPQAQPPAPAAAVSMLPPQPPPPTIMAPPPPPPPSAIPTRLHRIRPPPLAPPRPPPILPPAPPALSPLPPLPAVCMTAESPISAYMRRLRGMPSPIHVPTSPLGFGCLPSPRTPPSPGVPMPATSPRVRDP